MRNVVIISPMATGNGAYVIHESLGRHISGYKVLGYNPNWTMFPLSLRLVAPTRGADLIHTSPDYALFSHQKSTPLVITFHNYVLDPWMLGYSSLAQQIHYRSDLRWWTKAAVKKAHTITSVSRYIATVVKQDLAVPHDIRVIYNGIDTDHFVHRHKGRGREREIRVLFSGNLTRRKGAHWLPAIARSLGKNIHVYYTLGLRVQEALPPIKNLLSLGSVPYQDMPALYQKMDILLMPTVREGFGLSVAEAMASGLPVVATDCSALPELVENGKGGFLCPVGDTKAFAEKINLLAENPQLRREMGDNNRAVVEKRFTMGRMISEYQALFDEVLQH